MSTFENTVDVIGDEALTNSILSRSITELKDSNLSKVGGYAFYLCQNLVYVELRSATELGERAFNACYALEKIDLHTCTTLVKNALFNCRALTAVIIRSKTLCSLGSSALGYTPIASGTGYIYVPRSLVDSYKAASGWSTYANQIRAIEDYPEICDPYTWEGVAKNIELGTYKDVYKIGDCVPVDLGSEGIINMQIAAFDADTLADGSGTAAISWVAKELLATSQRMNAYYANGTEGSGTVGGWEKCEMRSYLQGTVKPLVPSGVAGMIRSVAKTQDAYDTSSNKFVQTTFDDLFIPSKAEVLDQSGIYGGLFQNDASRIKHKHGASDNSTWWLRSAQSIADFDAIGSSGSSFSYPAISSYSVCLCFCTGVTPT